MSLAGSTNRLRVDDSSSEPVYQQIAAQLQAEIERGERAPGERLPAIRSLAEALGLHRDTIALAYEQLGQSGLVESRVGAGTFVRALLAAPRIGTPRDESVGGEIALAPPVERLIALENTRPR